MAHPSFEKLYIDMNKKSNVKPKSNKAVQGIEQATPYKHCPDCGTHTGDGRRCWSCQQMMENEARR